MRLHDVNQSLVHTSTTQRGITASRDPKTGVSTPIKSGQESLFPDVNWANVVSLFQTRGLSPKQRSWMFEWTRNLYASNERLHRLGKVETPQCSFCDQTDNRWHMFYCKHNEIITSNLKKIIGEVCEETVSSTKLALVDFNPPELYRLALLFFFIESSMILQSSRAKQKEVTSKDFCATLCSKAKTLQASTGRVATFEAVLEWCGRLAAEVPLQQN